jgi:lysophospholipase L1-like esterase
MKKLIMLSAFSSLIGCLAVLTPFMSQGQDMQPRPTDSYFTNFDFLVKAPEPQGLVLQAGDRLAIIGDSITEQRMYSRILETYLTVCVPQLKITTRQYGWSGETAEGFLNRMTNDCLRFQPTVATLCYGMNDHRYRAYDEGNGVWYSNRYSSVVESLKSVGARVVLGSPGCVGKVPPWAQNNNASMDEMNVNLGRFRDIDIDIAAKEQVGFADVFWPLLKEGFEARQKYGQDFGLSGKDGVHPGWAGHVVMAYAFLKGMGLDGDIGTFTVDLAANTATATDGHSVDSFTNNVLTITSQRYPFCGTGALDKDDSIRAGMALVSFNSALNRLMLVAKGGSATNYAVTWGAETHTYTADQLAAGINLADDFVVNPFSEAFAKVDAAVAEKQAYETRQIKDLFHGPEGKVDPDATANLTEEARKPLAENVASAFVPVTHQLKIEAK